MSGKRRIARICALLPAIYVSVAAQSPVTTDSAKVQVYLIGRPGTAVYALKTGAESLLIDPGYQGDVEPILLDGMKTLGLDSAQVKTVLITRGHADHFGGALHLQEHFGAQIYLSWPDWNLIDHPPGRGAKAPQDPPAAIPKHAMVMKEGQLIVRRCEDYARFHSWTYAGSMGLIFPVQDNGAMQMAAILVEP